MQPFKFTGLSLTYTHGVIDMARDTTTYRHMPNYCEWQDLNPQPLNYMFYTKYSFDIQNDI